MAHPLAHLIPTSNTLQARSMDPATAGTVLASLYSPSGGFVGAFCRNSDRGPRWANRVADYDRSEFKHNTPGRIKRFSETPTDRLANDGAGKCSPNWRHALELWAVGGRQGPEPYTCYQDYGSCVDAEASEGITTMLGWRAAQPQYREKFTRAAAWYRYANRGYCSDGWSGWACATQALRLGIAFREKYDEADFEDDDDNEQIVARTWCRSGVPMSMEQRTKRDNPHAAGSITDFDEGLAAMRACFAAGGTIATGGTFTSGGSRPFTNGSTGPHMQRACGCDDSDEYRKFAKDTIGATVPANDFAVVMHQTWGANWSGACAEKYWPTWWGPRPQGAWVALASVILKRFSGDMLAWMPDLVGIPDTNPQPVPPSPTPGPAVVPITGRLQINATGRSYIVVPAPEA